MDESVVCCRRVRRTVRGVTGRTRSGGLAVASGQSGELARRAASQARHGSREKRFAGASGPARKRNYQGGRESSARSPDVVIDRCVRGSPCRSDRTRSGACRAGGRAARLGLYHTQAQPRTTADGCLSGVLRAACLPLFSARLISAALALSIIARHKPGAVPVLEQGCACKSLKEVSL